MGRAAFTDTNDNEKGREETLSAALFYIYIPYQSFRKSGT